MKMTILQILAVFFGAFTLFIGNRDLEHKKNEIPLTTYECKVNLDSFRNVIDAKQKEVNKELEGSISLLQDSKTFIMQCAVRGAFLSDSNCTRVIRNAY